MSSSFIPDTKGFVSATKVQSLTEPQQAVARSNIGIDDALDDWVVTWDSIENGTLPVDRLPATVVRESSRNQPNGFAGLSAEGEIVGPVIGRQVTYSQLTSITPASGEVVSTSDTFDIAVGDGATPGGVLIASRPRYAAISLEAVAAESVTKVTMAQMPVKANATYKFVVKYQLATANNDTAGAAYLTCVPKTGTQVRGETYSLSALPTLGFSTFFNPSGDNTEKEILLAQSRSDGDVDGVFWAEGVITAGIDHDIALKINLISPVGLVAFGVVREFMVQRIA